MLAAKGTKMDGPEGKQIESVEEMIGRFTGELIEHIKRWETELIDSPGDLEIIERQVHKVFARGGDMLVAGLVAVTISGGHVEQAAQQTRKQFSRPLTKGRERTIAVRLLGGMVLWMTTLYCSAKRKRFRQDDQPRVALDVTLSQFGFGKGVSPGLESRIARKVALCPSIRFAHGALAREGVESDAKAVSVCFVADGAPWIWDRIDAIIRLAKLQGVATYPILDCPHAVHHVSLALASLGLSKEERLPLYREHRTLLRNVSVLSVRVGCSRLSDVGYQRMSRSPSPVRWAYSRCSHRSLIARTSRPALPLTHEWLRSPISRCNSTRVIPTRRIS